MKINFTEENQARLKVLFVELGFTGEVLSGKFGANAYTVWEVLHVLSLESIRSLNKNLKKEVVALEEQDDWAVSDYQLAKAAKTRKWQEFVNLVVGYKLFEEEKAKKANKLKNAKAELAQMKEEVMTPTERIAAKEKEIEELEK